MYIYIYLERVCPLFWGLNPQKEGLFRSKQGSFGFQVYMRLVLIGASHLKCITRPVRPAVPVNCGMQAPQLWMKTLTMTRRFLLGNDSQNSPRVSCHLMPNNMMPRKKMW